MAEGDRPTAKATAFWGPIQGAARERASTAEIWQAIRDYAASSGTALPSNMFAEVNRMRSLATGLRVSSERLARAKDSDAITSSMIGRQVYGRNDIERSLAPAYHVRFELTTHTADGPSTGWYTLEYGGSLPSTVGQLMAEVGYYAEGLADSYGTAFGGLGDIEVGEF